ncbi:MAG: tRNA (adenosine(37)-N6)-threonylcarbamoyltransferase complex ATPase subunit type 1 TsaE [Defluviitaleaceae bacterium]|nr:tRNA (adenosine(37)-N6)-threonylcarbamoyltransferase complex ATPase subunit type 1 TsaE [Defluviitaleaceae bacterium]
MTYTTTSPEQTHALAARLAKSLHAGDVLCLYGGLGAGKTAFTKGLAEGLGILDTVTSPTFTIVCEYRSGRVPLFHYDVYRLGGSAGLEDTAFYDYLEGGGVVVVEWAQLVEDALGENVAPGRRVNVTITQDSNGGTTRRIHIERGDA